MTPRQLLSNSSQFTNYLSPHLLSDDANPETCELQRHKTLNVNSSDISFVVIQNRVYATLTHVCWNEENLKSGDFYCVHEFLIVGYITHILRPKNITSRRFNPPSNKTMSLNRIIVYFEYAFIVPLSFSVDLF
jgi:hypothetical protein